MHTPDISTEVLTDPKVTKRNVELRSQIDITKNYRRKLVQNWNVSIDYRRGKPFLTQSDDDQIAVPLDWSLTKTKTTALFSQVPEVRLSHTPDSAAAGPWLAKLQTKLNDTLVMGGIEAAMDEALPDCINAAGFGVCLVSYEAITQDKEVPSLDINALPPGMDPSSVPMMTIPQVIDKRYTIQRVSPADFLWPLSFMGSDFDQAPWLGRSGRISWAEAVRRFKVKEEDRALIVGEGRQTQDTLTQDIEKERLSQDTQVEFDEIFYKEFQFDTESQSYSTIHHLVFVTGKKEPVIDEPWKGQKLGQDGQITGSIKSPVRVFTLTYITDEAIPPSDSAIGRSQVNELNKSRTQIIQQRARNIPVRWYNPNLVDPAIGHSLMRGVWQNFVPIQGDGARAIGEVAKSSHPVENYTFDQVAKRDLNEAWTIGPNQMGQGQDVETKGESVEIANNFKTRISRDRAKVAAYVVGIAEVLGGLLCLYEDPSVFGEGFDPGFSRSLVFSVLADSTVVVDANQKLERLNQFLNTYAKSGFVQIEPVLREISILAGLDPNQVIKAPDPQSPPPPNVSLRLSGAADLMNPLCLASFLAEGKPPTAELIEQAKLLIQSAVTMPAPPPAPQMGGMGGPPPMGPDGQPMPAGMPPMGPGAGAPPSMPPAGSATPQAVGEAHPNMTILPKITKRSDDPAAGGKEPI